MVYGYFETILKLFFLLENLKCSFECFEYLYKILHLDVIGVWKPGDQGANLTIFGGVHGAAYGYLD